MSALLIRIHRWLGFTVGLWAALAGLSGSLLVFSDGMDRAFNPALFPARQSGVATAPAVPDLDRAEALVARAYPQRPQLGFRLPQATGEPLTVRLGGEQITEVFVDPNNLILLGDRAQYGGVMGFIWDLHVHLLAGETGETIAGVLGLCLLVALSIGLLLWWPGRRGLRAGMRVRWRAPLSARLSDLHTVTGALTLPLLLIPVVTGLMLVFHGVTTNWLLTGFGGEPLELPTRVEPAGQPPARLPLSTLLQAGDAALPQARAVSLSLPDKLPAPVIVRQRFPENSHPNGRSFVAVNPFTAQVMQAHSWREAGTGLRISDFKYPLHIGQAFGLPGRLLVLITGLIPAALLITGAWLWRRKRIIRRTGSNRSGFAMRAVSTVAADRRPASAESSRPAATASSQRSNGDV